MVGYKFTQILATWSPVLIHDYACPVPKPRALETCCCSICGKWLKGNSHAAFEDSAWNLSLCSPFSGQHLPSLHEDVQFSCSRFAARNSGCGSLSGDGSFPLVDVDVFDTLNRQDREMFRKGSRMGILSERRF